MKKHFILFLFISFQSLAQQDSNKGNISLNKSFAFNYENDYFYATDMYYTQGIRLEEVLPVFNKLPLMRIIPHLSNSITQYGLSLSQDCYTPTSISAPEILYGNRPYAAAMYLGHYQVSTNEARKQKLTSEIDLGIIGPCAACEEEQKGIHHALHNIQPRGWQYQVGTSPLINYKLRFEKGLFKDSILSFTTLTETNLGTYYDNASLGLDLHFGKMQSYFSGNRTRRFQLYGFLQGWAKAVAYNATLEGGVLNDSPYTLSPGAIENIVLKWSYGICLSYKKISLEFSKVYITREIITGLPHGWGHVSITDNF
jgi:lipid A 3-O-deacylase